MWNEYGKLTRKISGLQGRFLLLEERNRRWLELKRPTGWTQPEGTPAEFFGESNTQHLTMWSDQIGLFRTQRSYLELAPSEVLDIPEKSDPEHIRRAYLSATKNHRMVIGLSKQLITARRELIVRATQLNSADVKLLASHYLHMWDGEDGIPLAENAFMALLPDESFPLAGQIQTREIPVFVET